MYILAVLVIVLNVLDSVTTELCLHKLPIGTRGREGNPIMAWVMRKNGVLAEVIKHILILGIVIWFVVSKDIISLKFGVLAFSVVVLNNTYVLVVRWLAKKAVATPLRKLQLVCRIPDGLFYLLAIIIIFGSAFFGLWLWR